MSKNAMDVFIEKRYKLRKRFLKLFGADFRITNEFGILVAFARMKAFKLREDIRIFSDDTMTMELITIKACQIIDFSAAYDVWDTISGEKVGVLKRKGIKSLLRDEWVFADSSDVEIGRLLEDNIGLALARRFLSNLIPQKYYGYIRKNKVASFKGNFNPFIYKLDIDFSLDRMNLLDKRLGIAMAVLLGAIEGKQR